ncbi:MAG: protein translocase subunit SecD [Planctomycetota bacterium]|nr:protein translocase subunit SecD [Planctomycetota bacterium]
MRPILRNAIIVLAVLATALSFLLPVDKTLKLGKDLQGGVSLVYNVQIRPDEDSESVLTQVADALKRRLDPKGLLEIAIVSQGRDRLEITMPLPGESAKVAGDAYEQELARLSKAELTEARLEQVMALQGQARQDAINELAGVNPARQELLERAARATDESVAKRAEFERARAENADEATINRLIDEAGAARQASIDLRQEVLRSTLRAGEVAQALALSDEPHYVQDMRIRDKEKRVVQIPSDRDYALEQILKKHPEAKADLDRIVAAWEAYEREGAGIEDAQDLMKRIRGAGVLSFRITVDPGEHPEEARLREELRKRGPRNVSTTDARWYKVNKIHGWYNDMEQRELLLRNPQAFFASQRYVGEEYNGEYYILAWDKRGLRLTAEEGEWGVAQAYEDRDGRTGKPSIAFVMDTRGASQLGQLTLEPSKSRQRMAVLLDDEIYTAPNLISQISKHGQITGEFSAEEREYIIRVLNAGALQAKLAPEPISVSVLAPSLGKDNLAKGLFAGYICFAMCAGFLTIYYFGGGLVAAVGLVVNVFLLISLMAMQRAPFTLPGIAGVILTIAMAVDANVLIYERMREEFQRGALLKEAVRLGYQKAMSAIVDGNLTNLIVCIVLGIVGTPEIKGFAITMSMGVLTTLFAQLVVTRLLFDVGVIKLGIKRLPMLPTVVPAVQRAFTLNVDWMRLRPIFYVAFIGLIGLSVAMIAIRGSEMLDTEFRGGTAVTIRLKTNDDGTPLKMTRAQVQEKVAAEADSSELLRDLRNASILVVNPDADGVSSNVFTIKSLVKDPDAVQAAINDAFAGLLDIQPQLEFVGSDAASGRAVSFPITSTSLGETIGRPDVVRTIDERFVGGAAIILKDLEPAPSLASLRSRVDEVRASAEFADTVRTMVDVLVLEGNEDVVRSAVFLARDPDVSYFDDVRRWETDVRDREWAVVQAAYTEATTFLGVQAFSPAIAATFTAQAIAAILLSTVLIVIYVWVRFGSVRFSIAAIVPTLMDCFIAVGLIAFAEIVYDEAPGLATAVGLQPFKIDLTVIAAILTVLGYSINDKIVVLDRIRENRGKAKLIGRSIINESINQTMSRTIMTGSTTILSTLILYLIGGDGVKSFAYALGLGVIVGTFSSVMLAAPIMWSRSADEATRTPRPSALAPAGA